jgi:tetratricopeptide (TPR) repeat protein
MSSFHSLAAIFTRSAICLLLGAQYIVPPFGSQFAAAQSGARSQTQSRSQKLANPLNDLLDEAQRAVDAGSFEAAIAPLQKFVVEKPDVAYGHFQLAYVYTALHRATDARTEYERAIALDPKMPEAYLNLGLLLLEKEPAAAIAPLKKAVALLPAQSRPRILLGVAQERSSDFTAAANSFGGALRLDPNDQETLLHLGNLYLNLKRPADAEAKFRNALAKEPKSAAAAYGLAQSLAEQNKPEAQEAYRSYLELNPSDGAARVRVVHLLVDQQKYDLALAELDRADAGNRSSLESLKLRADIQVAQKKLDDAVATLLRAIQIAPDDPRLLGGLGRLYLQKRDFASAEKQLKAALQLEPNNAALWKDLSSTYLLADNCPATLAALDSIAKLETPSPGSWFVRGLCYDKLHQPQPALEAYQKFIVLDQDKNPDQRWQAEQRSKVLKRMLEGKK